VKASQIRKVMMNLDPFNPDVRSQLEADIKSSGVK